MDWELIFWVSGGILSAIGLLALITIGPRIPEDCHSISIQNKNIDDMEDRY